MRRVHLALITVQVLFGLWPVAGSAVLGVLSPQALIGFRLFLGAPCLILAARWGRSSGPRLTLKDLAQLFGLAILGITANQILFVEGLKRAGPINASVLLLIIPAVTLLAATLLGRERPSRLRLLGVAIAISGALALVGVERFQLQDAKLMGNLLLILNSTSYAVFLVLARPLIARLGALRVMSWVFLIGALQCTPYVLRSFLALDPGALPGWALASLAFILVGPTLLTYVLNGYALTRVESSVVAVYIYLQPLIATSAAWLVLGQKPTLRTFVAGTVIVVGVALSSELWKLRRVRSARAT
ncbi:MAG: DMT family transporter [Myxococcales bacterium]|nr:DMT family transporter [Myxococcales bacterium]